MPNASGSNTSVVGSRQVLRSVRKRAGENPYLWAHAFRVMGSEGTTYSLYRPHRFMPYLFEPYMEIAQLAVPGGEIVIMKCVQTGWTELAINSTLWFMDIKKEPALYMLQTDKQLGPFVLARINPAIDGSPYISEGFSKSDADSIGLKIGWKQPLYFRGAKSVGSLVEFSAGLVVQDERDQMVPEGIAASLGRREGMQHKWVIGLSNPSIPEHGIHIEWLNGSQGQWALWCDQCGEYVVPQWPESANRNHPGTPMCPSYDHELDKTKGMWIHKNPTAPYKSYSMDHFSSPRSTPIEMINDWDKIHGDPTKMAAFYNLHLGLPWAEAGTQITDVSGLPSMGEMVPSYARQAVMGVDVGTMLHVIIRRSYGGILWAGTMTWDEIARAMNAYNVDHCGIDIRPETKKAIEFARSFPGRVSLVAYNPNPMATESKWGEKEGVPVFTGLRTPMIDEALALIHTKTEAVPTNLPSDFWDHFRAVSRQYIRRNDGTVYVSYVNSKADHYVHAFNYAVFAGQRFQGSTSERTQFFARSGSRKKKEQEEKRDDGGLILKMAIAQGYVAPECTLDGEMIMALLQSGRDPCFGCNEDRSVCGGRPKGR